ncbi:hypothetical protein P8452_10707 [Trifolium repens]|nr:hypothetical protein P8452_10707 [Trifolium repens]
MRVFASQFLCCIRPFVLCSTTISLRPLDWPKSPTMRAAISDVIIYPLPFGIFQQSGGFPREDGIFLMRFNSSSCFLLSLMMQTNREAKY